MQQQFCLREKTNLVDGITLLAFDAPELANALRAGQFALARDPFSFEPYLRRAVWFYRAENNRVAFTLASNDALALRARVGDTLDLLAPLGHAVDFDLNARHILLLGEGMNFAPLIAIAHEAIANGREVVLAISNAPAIGHLLAPEIEYRTDETLSAEIVTWADAMVASGAPKFYRQIVDALQTVRYRLDAGLARGLVDVPMPCGTGQCFACAIDTARGVKLVCAHGAWFDLIDLENRSAR